MKYIPTISCKDFFSYYDFTRQLVECILRLLTNCSGIIHWKTVNAKDVTLRTIFFFTIDY